MIDLAITAFVVICLIGMVSGIMLTWYRRYLVRSGALTLHMRLSRAAGEHNQAQLRRLADTEVAESEISDSEYEQNATQIVEEVDALTDSTLRIEEQIKQWQRQKHGSETVE